MRILLYIVDSLRADDRILRWIDGYVYIVETTSLDASFAINSMLIRNGKYLSKIFEEKGYKISCELTDQGFKSLTAFTDIPCARPDDSNNLFHIFLDFKAHVNYDSPIETHKLIEGKLSDKELYMARSCYYRRICEALQHYEHMRHDFDEYILAGTHGEQIGPIFGHHEENQETKLTIVNPKSKYPMKSNKEVYDYILKLVM